MEGWKVDVDSLGIFLPTHLCPSNHHLRSAKPHSCHACLGVTKNYHGHLRQLLHNLPKTFPNPKWSKIQTKRSTYRYYIDLNAGLTDMTWAFLYIFVILSDTTPQLLKRLPTSLQISRSTNSGQLRATAAKMRSSCARNPWWHHDYPLVN